MEFKTLFLLLVILSSSFIYAAGTLNVTTTPSDANVYLNNSFRGRTPIMIRNLEPAEYPIAIQKEGYENYSANVTIYQRTTTNFSANLTAIEQVYPGTLFANSTPIDANFYFNGSFRGRTPLTLRNLPAGGYPITLEKEGYENYSANVTIYPRTTTNFSANLTAIEQVYPGTLFANSTPIDANFYFNGSFRGRTPLTIRDLEAGDYPVTLEKEGYANYSANVTVYQSTTTNFSANLSIIRDNSTGMIWVNSTPSNARIYLNGSYKGTTPRTITNITPGNYTLNLSKIGYQPYSTMVEVVGGGMENIQVNLTLKEEGTVYATSSPSGARAYFNGQYKGTTPMQISGIVFGNYTLNLSKTGYEQYSTMVEVSIIGTINISVNLTPLGSLFANSAPNNTNVYLNGTYKGRTPITLSNLVNGEYSLLMQKTGYENYSANVTIYPGATTNFSANLTAIEQIFPGNLFVNSTPGSANVYLNGSYRERTPITIRNLAIGEYPLILQKTGYENYSENVTIYQRATTNVSANLTPKAYGSLNVSSIPSQASIYIDNRLQGITPRLIVNIEQGTRTLRLSKNGYYNYSENITIYQGATANITANLSMIIDNATGIIFVASSPSSANVYLNNSFKGRTPRTISNITPGNYTLNLSKAGYQPYSTMVEVVGGGMENIQVNLTPLGSLFANSTPTSANVYLNGTYKGRTPITLSNLVNGDYALILQKTGYENYSANVTIYPGATTNFSANLTRLEQIFPGNLFVNSTPGSANVYLNGSYRGRTPLTLRNLAAGEYPVTVQKEGYENYSANVTIYQRVTTNFSANLAPLQYGDLFVNSTPQNASVYLNDSFRGETPVTIRSLAVGQYGLFLSKEGYYNYTEEIQIHQNQMTNVSANLTQAG